MAALSRMAEGTHRKVSIKPSDTIVFSSHPIPGNEKSVSKVVNELGRKGATVILEDTHVSGHACREDLKLIYSLVKPKYAMPVHGEYRHMQANAKIAELMGIPKKNIFTLQDGDVLSVSEESCKVTGKVTAGRLLVDGLGVGDVGNIVLRDRQNLAENGIIIVVVALERGGNHVVSGPDIVSRGFVYMREAEELIEEARQLIQDALDDCINKRVTDWGRIKMIIRDTLSEFLWKKMKRSPLILPIIMDV